MTTYARAASLVSDGDADNELYILFARARYLAFRAREKELQRYGLSPEQAQVLGTIQSLNSTATPAELSRILLRQPHTVAAMIERMEQKGLVKKVKDLDRKNLVRVVITERGKNAYAVTIKRGPIHRIMSGLNDQERECFQRCLEKIMEKSRAELGMDRDELPESEDYPEI